LKKEVDGCVVYCEIICQQHGGGQKQRGRNRTSENNYDNEAAAAASRHSTPSPVMPKQLTPLTPASARKNKNKHSRSPSADGHNKPLSMRTNQPQDIWVRSPSPAVGAPGHSSRAANRRSTSPGVGSRGERSGIKGQRSNNEDGEKGSVVFSKWSSSLSSNRRRTTADQQASVIFAVIEFVVNVQCGRVWFKNRLCYIFN